MNKRLVSIMISRQLKLLGFKIKNNFKNKIKVLILITLYNLLNRINKTVFHLNYLWEDQVYIKEGRSFQIK